MEDRAGDLDSRLSSNIQQRFFWFAVNVSIPLISSRIRNKIRVFNLKFSSKTTRRVQIHQTNFDSGPSASWKSKDKSRSFRYHSSKKWKTVFWSSENTDHFRIKNNLIKIFYWWDYKLFTIEASSSFENKFLVHYELLPHNRLASLGLGYDSFKTFKILS